MMDFIQLALLTLIEALCCELFFRTFLEVRKRERNYVQYILFLILFLGFSVIAYLPVNVYTLKAFLSIGFILAIMHIQYNGKIINKIFLSFAYYGLIICVDRIMLIIIYSFPASYAEAIFEDPVKTTILALLCKAVLFVCIMILNRIFRVQSDFYLIPNKEWIRFICFPIITIVCMIAFALVLSNFLVFYIIQDVIANEKSVQEMRVSRERLKTQMDMYEYTENVYKEQRNKMHDFKNHMTSIQSLLYTGKYKDAEAYLKKINQDWMEEIDYINTNNAIVNSVINQKFRQARAKNIPMIFTISNLENLTLSDEDIVTILANLLDNAIEACEKVKTDNKEIKVRFTVDKGKTLLSVRNPMEGTLNMKNGKLLTTKSDKKQHGIGTANIAKTVQKYKGECVYSCNNGYFTYSIVI